MSEDTLTPEPEQCSTCGAVLPEDAEGLCPQCGTPFGLKTMVMPALTPELMEQHRARREAAGNDRNDDDGSQG